MAGLTSCWMRLAKPFAGAKHTGFHFPLIDGTEVQIAFENGDPDLPYIAHVMHDGLNPDLITSDNRWMSRNAIHTQSNNTIQLEDFPEEEHVKVATEGGGKAQLNLGHMVNAERKKRGGGAELRADEHVAVRGGAGVLVSADTQPRATGQQLEMRAAQALLEQALDHMQALTDAAKAAQAHAAEVEQQKVLLEETLTGLKQAGILVSAPAGMGLVSVNHLQLSAQRNLIATAGGNADLGVLRKLTVAAGDAISLFAQKLGLKFFANQGKVEIQAQGDEMSLGALKDLTVTSTNGRVVISASKEVWIGSGGSYIKITGSGIENVSPGDILERCAFWDIVEPASETVPLPQFPRTACKSCLIDAMRQGSPGVYTS